MSDFQIPNTIGIKGKIDIINNDEQIKNKSALLMYQDVKERIDKLFSEIHKLGIDIKYNLDNQNNEISLNVEKPTFEHIFFLQTMLNREKNNFNMFSRTVQGLISSFEYNFIDKIEEKKFG